MASQTLSPILSLPDVVLSPRGAVVVKKAVVERALLKLLTKRLKELDIIWDPPTFRKALANPKLPADLLEKLERLIAQAERSHWKISKASARELDETVEDIESYNPAYRAWLKKSHRDASREIKAGRFATTEELMAKYGIT